MEYVLYYCLSLGPIFLPVSSWNGCGKHTVTLGTHKKLFSFYDIPLQHNEHETICFYPLWTSSGKLHLAKPLYKTITADQAYLRYSSIATRSNGTKTITRTTGTAICTILADLELSLLPNPTACVSKKGEHPSKVSQYLIMNMKIKLSTSVFRNIRFESEMIKSRKFWLKIINKYSSCLQWQKFLPPCWLVHIKLPVNVIGKVSLNLSFSSYMTVAFSVLLEVPIVVLNYKFIKFVIFSRCVPSQIFRSHPISTRDAFKILTPVIPFLGRAKVPFGNFEGLSPLQLHFPAFFGSFSILFPMRFLKVNQLKSITCVIGVQCHLGESFRQIVTCQEITYIIVISHRSLVHNVVLSDLEFFVSVCSIRFSIANTEFPRHFIPRNIFQLSSNIKLLVPCLGIIWILYFWSKINRKIFHSVNNI